MTSEHQNDLVRKHYATDDHLRIRQQIHDEYTIPDRSFADWALERIPLKENVRVLDAGCGNGMYYNKLIEQGKTVDYYGIDLLESMVEHHPLKDTGRISIGNVEKLPYDDASYDVVMANHMMHHIDNIERAISECKRVLAPGGVLVVATNSMSTMPELQVLMRRAIVLLTRSGAASVRAPEMPTDRFALENGIRMLSQQFYTIVRHDLPSALVFPDVEPAMQYLESTRDLREESLPDDVVWEDVMMIMRQQINQLIKHLGELVINKQAGILLASNDGRFIGDGIEKMKPFVTSI